MPESEQNTPSVEELIDFAVYAPIGLALHCLENYPELVERGKRQIGFARSIGKMAFAAANAASSGRGGSSSADAERAGARQKSDPPAKKATTKRATKPEASKAGSKKTAAASDASFDPANHTAKEVIAKVQKLTTRELASLEKAEKAGKARVTVLRAITARRNAVDS